MRKFSSFFLLCLSLALTYALFEAGMQLMIAKGVVGGGYAVDFAEFEKRAIAANKSLRDFAASLPLHPLLGWDSQARRQGATTPTSTLLLLGDSVAYGQDADIGKNDFATLLAKSLEPKGLRLVNAATSGYGLDQMYLTFLTRLAADKPDVALFCFIPHDIRRLGLSFFNLAAKPRFFPETSGTRLALPDLAGFHESFRAARSGYWLGFWYLQQAWLKKEYNYPARFIDYYATVLHRILGDLAHLATQRSLRIVFAAIPNQADPVSSRILAPLVKDIIGKEYASPNLLYADLEPCLRERSADANKSGGATWAEFEAEHPGPRGHGLIAQCLAQLELEIFH